MRTQGQLDLLVGDNVRHAAAGIGVLCLLQAAWNLLAAPLQVREPLAIAPLLEAALLLPLSLALRRRSVPAHWLHPISAIVALVALANILLTATLLNDPRQSVYLMLLVIGAGFLFLSFAWLAFVLSLSVGAWLWLAWNHPPHSDWLSFSHGLFCSLLLSALIQRARIRTSVRIEQMRLRGEELVKRLSLKLESFQNEAGGRMRFHASPACLSDHDFLTGLPNRDRFTRELELRVSTSREERTSAALLWLDIDRFKEVNEVLGHSAGDEFLSSVGNLLSRRLSNSAVCARLAGDEFAILLPRADEAHARATAALLLDAFKAHHIVVQGQLIRMTASIGIAMFPDHAATVPALMARADSAMHQAKGAGRNRYCFHTPVNKAPIPMRSRIDWARRIREVLEREGFLLYAQDIFDLRNERIAQYELLLRMPGDRGLTEPPGAFLETAERFGLIQEIDRWVVHKAIDLLASHPQPVGLEVNISAKSIEDVEMLALIDRDLGRTSIDPSRLILEITETAAITNLAKATEFIRALKETGVRFALDDFGMGFSSFHHLKHLPVDYLKIDGSYIHDLPGNRVDQHLVQAMVQVARGLGKETIAEFVGGEETVRLLRRYGVRYGQGYHYGQPRPVDEIIFEAGSFKRGSLQTVGA